MSGHRISLSDAVKYPSGFGFPCFITRGRLRLNLISFGIPAAGLLQKLRNEAGPAGLMARTDSRSVVPVKVFVKKQMVAEICVVLQPFFVAEDGPPAILIL